jgi:ribose transport system permease protein
MLKNFSQEKIVFALAMLLFVGFSLTLPNFLTPENIAALVRGVAILGILGIAMVIVIIGRGIDLSIVANMAISVAWTFTLVQQGVSLPLAIALGFTFALGVGLVVGIFVAYAEIPPLFATLAIGTFIYGFGRFEMVPLDVVPLPEDIGWLRELGSGSVLGIPMSVAVMGMIAFAVFVFLRYTKAGQFVYAMGDNHRAARIGGVPMRPVLLLQYTLAAAIAFAAGLTQATAVSSMSTRVAISTLVYDVILVVVLGGVGLSGGRGNVRNVLVGTMFVGILQNGMTILDLQYTTQNVLKGVLLLAAIIADSIVNPRDEQTDQQGDI